MKNKENEHTVTFMNQELPKSEKYTSKRSEGIIPGLTFIFAGTILLLNSLGYIPWEIWGILITYWPILLILIGLRIILGNSFLSLLFMSVLTVLVFATIMLLSIKEVSPTLLNNLPKGIDTVLNNIQIILKK